MHVPSTNEIERILVGEISRMFPDNSPLTADTPLQALGLDSLRLFEIFVLVEKQFGVSLLDSPLTRGMLETPAALAAHIAGRLSAKGPENPGAQ